MIKLINFFEMPHLNQLRYEMDAPLAKSFKVTLKLTPLDEDDLRRLGAEGIEVDFNEIKPQGDKTLSYKGERVLVYIRDVNTHAQGEPKLPKFHISHCKTLENMRSTGRGQRYVVANRNDGYFHIRINNGDAEFKQLDVCQFCLENLHWNNFSRMNMTSKERQIAVSKFSIAEFFARFPKPLLTTIPNHTSDTAPLNDYSHNWPEISEKIKQERNYTCDNLLCRIQLVEDKKYLHVHHINGLKNDNSKSNLKVLCIRCHANEPQHEHMKGAYYDEFIKKYAR